MSSSEEGRLRVTSRPRTVEIVVSDGDLGTVARGFGAVDVSLPAGLYQIDYRAGAVVSQEMVSLRAGGVVERTRTVDVPGSAPLRPDDAVEASQARAVERLLAAPTCPPRGDAGVLVFARRGGGVDEGWSADDACRRLDLVDGADKVISDFENGVERNPAEGWVALSTRLPAGGYALRVREADAGYEPRNRGAGAEPLLEQSLWLAGGWQTLVFIPGGRSGPRPERASIHMVRLGEAWRPPDGEIASAVEVALAALRQGRNAVPPDVIDLMADGKFDNPMLGLLAAHALLASEEPDQRRFDGVVRWLSALLPGHPDAAALRWAGHARFRPDGPALLEPPVAWPPVLMASYRALLRCDVAQPGVIVEGSMAERVSERLVVGSVWTTWRLAVPAAARAEAAKPPIAAPVAKAVPAPAPAAPAPAAAPAPPALAPPPPAAPAPPRPASPPPIPAAPVPAPAAPAETPSAAAAPPAEGGPEPEAEPLPLEGLLEAKAPEAEAEFDAEIDHAVEPEPEPVAAAKPAGEAAADLDVAALFDEIVRGDPRSVIASLDLRSPAARRVAKALADIAVEHASSRPDEAVKLDSFLAGGGFDLKRLGLTTSLSSGSTKRGLSEVLSAVKSRKF